MQKLMSALVAFLLTAMIAGIFYQQHGQGTPIFFTERSSVPPVVLTFGPVIMIFVLWLYRVFLKETPATDRLAPRFFESDIVSGRLGYLWEKISVFVMLVLPVIGFLYFWERFDKGIAWPLEVGRLCDLPADTVLSPVDLYTPTDPLWYGFKARYRYGSYGMITPGAPARETCALPNGVDYYPFTQPLLMAGLSGAVMLMSGWNLLLVMRRRPIRRASLEREEPGNS